MHKFMHNCTIDGTIPIVSKGAFGGAAFLTNAKKLETHCNDWAGGEKLKYISIVIRPGLWYNCAKARRSGNSQRRHKAEWQQPAPT
jgi:hypothetical protein